VTHMTRSFINSLYLSTNKLTITWYIYQYTTPSGHMLWALMDVREGSLSSFARHASSMSESRWIYGGSFKINEPQISTHIEWRQNRAAQCNTNSVQERMISIKKSQKNENKSILECACCDSWASTIVCL
jgi:hypothetical protein